MHPLFEKLCEVPERRCNQACVMSRVHRHRDVQSGGLGAHCAWEPAKDAYLALQCSAPVQAPLLSVFFCQVKG